MVLRLSRIFVSLSFVLGLAVALGAVPDRALAFHFPWDQGHDTFTPEDGDDDNDPGDDDCNNSASPFQVASGNFTYILDEIFIPARGPDFDITLTYNSQDNRSGVFGHGWSHAFDQRVVKTSDGVQVFAICHKASGNRERYTKNADGTYRSPEDVFDTLTELPDGTFELRDRQGIVRRFDDEGRLASIADRNGNSMALSYLPSGFLSSLTDANGRTMTFNQGADGRVASIIDPASRTFQLSYDSSGNLTSFTDPLNNTTSYQYDSEHNLTRVTNARGNVAQRISYDSDGRVRTYTELGESEIWTVTYSDNHTTKRNQSGNTWTYDFNENGNVTRVTDPLGNTEEFSYGDNLLTASVTDKNGRVIAYEYDAAGNMTRLTDAAGNDTLFSYLNDVDFIASITDPSGSQTVADYDNRGNLVRIVDPLGNVTQLSYDSAGQITTVTDASGQSTALTYDGNGNITQTVNNVGKTTTATYDALGNVTAITDALGRTTQFQYDSIGRLIGEADPGGGVTQYQYDAVDNLIAVVDPNGNRTSFEYDNDDNLARITNPNGSSITYTHDRRGNKITATNSRGQQTTFAYDALDRLTRKTLPNDEVTYTYDAIGQPTSISDNDSRVSYSYDSLNRVVGTQTAATAAQPATSITYTFDGNGNRTSMTDPLGRTTSYSYDANNRLVSLTQPNGDVASFAYDVLSRRTQASLPNGVTTALNYDGEGQLLSLINQATATLSQFVYTYDGAGNRLTHTDLDGSHTFSYDALDRILSASHPQPANVGENYTYDSVGNRLSSHTSAFYTYDSANRLLDDAEFDYTYDADGNLTQKRDKASGLAISYSYDAEGQLERIDFPDGTFAEYRYDPLGRRIEKNVNGQITRYIYDGEDILQELDGSNNVVAQYVHGPGIDEPISMERNGQTFFYHTDGLGSIRQLTDSSGSVVQSYLYDSFGNIVEAQGGLPNPYTYTGREFDAESGLYYYRARYYDARIGRFLTEDPAGFFADVNFYAYVRNNPVKLVDPSGQFVQSLIGGGVSVITGWAISKLTGSCYTWKDALVDFGTGAIGAGLASKAQKLWRIRKLRNLAKSRGLTNLGKKGYTETWSSGVNGGERLLIKFQPAKSPNVAAGSKVPRFSYRTGPGQYWDPFTGATGPGPKSALGHVPLEPGISRGAAAGVGSATGAAGGASRAAARGDCECK